jgi:hypothetical protein
MNVYIGKNKNKELIVEIESVKNSKGKRESIIFHKEEATTAIDLIKFIQEHSDLSIKIIDDRK